MSVCFAWILILAGGVFVIASLLRWFEQTADAVDRNEWNKLTMLVVCPFACWFYPSRYSAGRPTGVPHHEPVRGFGKIPGTRTEMPMPSDKPPPGTPPEFIGPPVIPPKKPKAAIDPDKLAKLKQKMREQGMLDE
jgi:hypothetical protein